MPIRANAELSERNVCHDDFAFALPLVRRQHPIRITVTVTVTPDPPGGARHLSTDLTHVCTYSMYSGYEYIGTPHEAVGQHGRGDVVISLALVLGSNMISPGRRG